MEAAKRARTDASEAGPCAPILSAGTPSAPAPDAGAPSAPLPTADARAPTAGAAAPARAVVNTIDKLMALSDAEFLRVIQWVRDNAKRDSDARVARAQQPQKRIAIIRATYDYVVAERDRAGAAESAVAREMMQLKIHCSVNPAPAKQFETYVADSI